MATNTSGITNVYETRCGTWYLSKGGRYGGSFRTKDAAIAALPAFLGCAEDLTAFQLAALEAMQLCNIADVSKNWKLRDKIAAAISLHVKRRRRWRTKHVV